MFPVPAELDTTLHWYANFLLTNNGQSYCAVRFYTNAAFSPDIVSPSNKPNGFTALAALYGSYRVIGYTYKISLFTRETFGFTTLIRNTNTDPGTSSGQLAYSGEALSTTKQVPTAGAPPTIFRGRHNIAEVTGRPIENDDILAADVTAIPADQTFLGIFCQSLDTFTTAGVNVSITIAQRVRFFNRKLVNDSFMPALPYILNGGDCISSRALQAQEGVSQRLDHGEEGIPKFWVRDGDKLVPCQSDTKKLVPVQVLYEKS